MEVKDIVLRPGYNELVSWMPKTFLKNKLRQYPDVDKQVLVELFQDALVESKDKTESIQVYDFCIIMSDQDYEVAFEIKEALVSNLKLKGCMLEEIIQGGMDILDSYDFMMKRSCKVLFLITRHFTRDNFCRRIQNGAVFQSLMNKARNAQEKCVPVMLESNRGIVETPLGLSGIAGITYDDAQKSIGLFKRYFATIHYDRTIIQKKGFEEVCENMFKNKVEEHLREEQLTQLAIEDAKRRQLAIRDAPQLNEQATSKALASLATVPDDDSLLSSIQQALSATGFLSTQQQKNFSVAVSQTNGLEHSSSISISGTQNHIGTKIENNITIVVGGTNAINDCDEDSSSADSD